MQVTTKELAAMLLISHNTTKELRDVIKLAGRIELPTSTLLRIGMVEVYLEELEKDTD